MGYAPADFAEWVEPATRPAFDAAIAVLKASGVQFVETKLPDFPYSAALVHHSQRRNGFDLRAAHHQRQSGRTGRQAADCRPESQPGTSRQGLPEGDAPAPPDAGRDHQDLRHGGRAARHPAGLALPRRSISPSTAVPAAHRPRTPASAPSFPWAISPDSRAWCSLRLRRKHARRPPAGGRPVF